MSQGLCVPSHFFDNDTKTHKLYPQRGQRPQKLWEILSLGTGLDVKVGFLVSLIKGLTKPNILLKNKF